MQHLRDVIAALRREILDGLAGFEDSSAVRSSTRLTPEKVIVSLQFASEIQTGQDGSANYVFPAGRSNGDLRSNASNGSGASAASTAGAPVMGSGGLPHTVTLEFRVGSVADALGRDVGRASARAESTSRPKTLVLEGEEAERAARELAAVLGQPGFDSSARAAVLRQVTSELTREHVAAILESLIEGRKPLSGDPPVLKQARHLIAGVLRSGPMKSVPQGAEALMRLLEEHPLPALNVLIGARWKTQQAWLE